MIIFCQKKLDFELRMGKRLVGSFEDFKELNKVQCPRWSIQKEWGRVESFNPSL